MDSNPVDPDGFALFNQSHISVFLGNSSLTVFIPPEYPSLCRKISSSRLWKRSTWSGRVKAQPTTSRLFSVTNRVTEFTLVRWAQTQSDTFNRLILWGNVNLIDIAPESNSAVPLIIGGFAAIDRDRSIAIMSVTGPWDTLAEKRSQGQTETELSHWLHAAIRHCRDQKARL